MFFLIAIVEVIIMINIIFLLHVREERLDLIWLIVLLKFVVIKKKKKNRSWPLKILNASYNHDNSSDMSKHPPCHCFSEVEASRVKATSKVNIPPLQIFSSSRQSNPKVQAIAKNVYNMKAKFCHEYLNGLNMLQALLEDLSAGAFIYNFKHDAKGYLTHLFFSHPISMVLRKSFSGVFVMDCT